MNTFNLITAIALLACISTPAYVIYYLKYFIREQIKTLQKDLFYLDSEVEKNESIVSDILVERNRELIDFNNLIENVESQIKSEKSKTKNTFENLHVDMNYVKRTLNDDMSKVNERIDLTNALHKNTIDKIQEKVSKKNDIQWVSQHHFNSERLSELKHIFTQLDSLQSLNITTQNILTRINSKEFAREIWLEWMKHFKEEAEAKEAKRKNKKKNNEQEQEQDKSVTSTKPTESVKSEVVNMIKEQPIIPPTPITTSPVDEIVEKKPKKPKADSKRVIRNRELEIFFKEQTRLTYRGFVIKFGEEAFKREKQLVYKRLYYYKFFKQQKQKDYIQSEITFKTKQ
jgi:hypothetical protein